MPMFLIGEFYAVKMFSAYDKSQRSQLLKEIRLLLDVDSDSLIKLKGSFHNEGMVGIILEYMDMGSLDGALTGRRLTEPALASIASQILVGLACLHYDHALHRDLKPANILINSLGKVKISDFGISKSLVDSTGSWSQTSVGTSKYMSPERFDGLLLRMSML